MERLQLALLDLQLPPAQTHTLADMQRMRLGKDAWVYDKPPISVEELKELTSEYERAAESGADYPVLIEKLEEIHGKGQYRFLTVKLDIGNTFFRARLMDRKPSVLRDITCPPPSAVKVNGRLNAEHESLFYACSGGPGACLLECGADTAATGILSRWSSRGYLQMNHIGYCGSMISAMEKGREFLTEFSPVEQTDNLLFLTEWQSALFTRRVEKGREELYRASIGFAKWALSLDEFDGLIYPSIANQFGSDNLVLRPDRAAAKLLCEGAQFFRIRSCRRAPNTSVNQHKIDVIDTAGRPFSNGRLNWLSEPTGFIPFRLTR